MNINCQPFPNNANKWRSPSLAYSLTWPRLPGERGPIVGQGGGLRDIYRRANPTASPAVCRANAQTRKKRGAIADDRRRERKPGRPAREWRRTWALWPGCSAGRRGRRAGRRSWLWIFWAAAAAAAAPRRTRWSTSRSRCLPGSSDGLTSWWVDSFLFIPFVCSAQLCPQGSCRWWSDFYPRNWNFRVLDQVLVFNLVVLILQGVESRERPNSLNLRSAIFSFVLLTWDFHG